MPIVRRKKVRVSKAMLVRADRYRVPSIRRRISPRMPTFTETIVRPAKISGNAGNVFSVSMDEIPQLAQYTNLYRQYKINWAKISILPDYNSFDGAQTLTAGAMPRIAWAINNTPLVAAPANESALLEDNGAKVRPLANQWAASFKPVPNLAMPVAGAVQLIPVKPARSMFLSFAPGGSPNPQHYGISYWISQALAGGATPSSYTLIVKINFSLRDPQ